MLASPTLKLPVDGNNIASVRTCRNDDAQDILDFKRNLFGSTTVFSLTDHVSNDNVDHLRVTHTAIIALLSSYYSALKQSVFEGIKKQTAVVLNHDEFEDEDELPSIDSYRTFLRSVAQLKPARRPNLGINGKGNFLAVWRSENFQAVFEFMPFDRMKWTLTLVQAGDRNIISGSTEVKKIREIISMFGAEEVLDEKK